MSKWSQDSLEEIVCSDGFRYKRKRQPACSNNKELKVSPIGRQNTIMYDMQKQTKYTVIRQSQLEIELKPQIFVSKQKFNTQAPNLEIKKLDIDTSQIHGTDREVCIQFLEACSEKIGRILDQKYYNHCVDLSIMKGMLANICDKVRIAYKKQDEQEEEVRAYAEAQLIVDQETKDDIALNRKDIFLTNFNRQIKIASERIQHSTKNIKDEQKRFQNKLKELQENQERIKEKNTFPSQKEFIEDLTQAVIQKRKELFANYIAKKIQLTMDQTLKPS